MAWDRKCSPLIVLKKLDFENSTSGNLTSFLVLPWHCILILFGKIQLCNNLSWSLLFHCQSFPSGEIAGTSIPLPKRTSDGNKIVVWAAVKKIDLSTIWYKCLGYHFLDWLANVASVGTDNTGTFIRHRRMTQWAPGLNVSTALSSSRIDPTQLNLPALYKLSSTSRSHNLFCLPNPLFRFKQFGYVAFALFPKT